MYSYSSHNAFFTFAVYMDFGICTCKWRYSALLESLEQSHQYDFWVPQFFPGTKLHTMQRKGVFKLVYGWTLNQTTTMYSHSSSRRFIMLKDAKTDEFIFREVLTKRINSTGSPRAKCNKVNQYLSKF